MKNVKFLNLLLNTFNFFCVFIFLAILASLKFAEQTWGKIDISQFLFFARVDCAGGVDYLFALKCVLFCLVCPLVVVIVIFSLLKMMRKDNQCYFSRLSFLGYAMLVFYLVSEYWHFPKIALFMLLLIFLLLFFLNLHRNYSSVNIFWCVLIGLLINFYYIMEFSGKSFIFKERGYSNFYAENYVDVLNEPLTNTEKRNVIVVFVESFNKDFSVLEGGEVVLNDAESIQFSNFIEGYVQRWTQSALFSALTGVHIHYVSDFWRYKEKVKYTRYLGELVLEADEINKLGENYKFETPKIASIGKISEKDGYQNLFVKGGNLDFSGTRNLLTANGFSAENVYGMAEINKELGDIDNKINRFQGYDDTVTFGVFKRKISELDKEKPFFAIMFTLDTHLGYKIGADEVQKITIENLNDFIAWFEKQDFYENTSLVILGDHNQMGPKVKTGAKIYNAFLNLPDKLKQGINTERTFNQIDMFPTILEIMGYELPKRKAGVGVSLFSDEKTLAERYSYQKQVEIFSQNDRFYYQLWQSKK